jgi:hypothetical protein
MSYRIILRKDVSTRWQRNNPILMLGEPGYETDTRRIKIGDGISRWNILPYLNMGENIIIRERWIDKEIPEGEIDGLNSQFSLSTEHIPGSEHVYLNGQLQDSEGDYTIENNIIDFDFPPVPGSKIRVTYRCEY